MAFSFPDRLHTSAKPLNFFSTAPHLSMQFLSPHGFEFQLRPHPAFSGGIPRASLGMHATPVDVWIQQYPLELAFQVRFPVIDGLSEFASEPPVWPFVQALPSLLKSALSPHGSWFGPPTRLNFLS